MNSSSPRPDSLVPQQATNDGTGGVFGDGSLDTPPHDAVEHRYRECVSDALKNYFESDCAQDTESDLSHVGAIKAAREAFNAGAPFLLTLITDDQDCNSRTSILAERLRGAHDAYRRSIGSLFDDDQSPKLDAQTLVKEIKDRLVALDFTSTPACQFDQTADWQYCYDLRNKVQQLVRVPFPTPDPDIFKTTLHERKFLRDLLECFDVLPLEDGRPAGGSISTESGETESQGPPPSPLSTTTPPGETSDEGLKRLFREIGPEVLQWSSAELAMRLDKENDSTIRKCKAWKILFPTLRAQYQIASPVQEKRAKKGGNRDA